MHMCRESVNFVIESRVRLWFNEEYILKKWIE